MKTILKPIGTKEGPLGELNLPVLENIEEAIETYGDRQTLALIQRAMNIDTERIGRAMLVAEKSVEEAQDAVDNYRPGTRKSGKPSDKTLLSLMAKFGKAGKIDELLKAQELNETDGVIAAVEYLRANESGI